MAKYLDYNGLKSFWNAVKTHVLNSLKSVEGLEYNTNNGQIYLKEASDTELGGVKISSGAYKFYHNNENANYCDNLNLTVYKFNENADFDPVSNFLTGTSEDLKNAKDQLVVSIPITELTQEEDDNSTIHLSDQVLATQHYVDYNILKNINNVLIHKVKIVNALPSAITEPDLANTYLVSGYKEEDNLIPNDFDYYDELVVSIINEDNFHDVRIIKLGSTGNQMGSSSWPSSELLHNGYVFNKEYKLLPGDIILFYGTNLNNEVRKIIVDRNYSILNREETSLLNDTIEYTNNSTNTIYVKVIFYMLYDSEGHSGLMHPLAYGIGLFNVKVGSIGDEDIYEEYIFVPEYDNNDELVKNEGIVQGKFEKIGSSRDKFSLSTITDSEINSITNDNN